MTTNSLIARILAANYTKSAALAALVEAEEQVRRRELPADEYAEAKRVIEAIEPLYLELAVSLNEQQIKMLARKLREDYGENFLMEISVNPNLLGGARISYKGVLRDYSLKSRAEKFKQLWK